MRDAPALLIAHITVRTGKLDFELSCDAERLHVGADAAARALGLLPNLARHVCVNRKGERFSDDIEGTESAHLFEHVAIELLGQAFPARAASGAFFGYTTFADVGKGELAPGRRAMRTTISCADDLAGMCAAREALRVVNWAFDAPGRMSDHASGYTFGAMSDHTAGRTSAHAPDHAPDHAPSNTPAATPDGGMESAPSENPAAAPDVATMVRAVQNAAGADAR